ncbi:MAG: gluconolactonase [Rhodothermales bacterium]|jgi:gluconolactonase
MRLFLFAILVLGPALLAADPSSVAEPGEPFGRIESLDPAFDALVPKDAKIERLATGFLWAEGPTWVPSGGFVAFSDVKRNIAYRWKPGEGLKEYLNPSGFTGESTDSPEPGSNGLNVDLDGHVIACQHGDRRIVRVRPDGSFETLADRWEGKRFNSPNDVAIHPTLGDIFFTDPPWGLKGAARSSYRELDFLGVYRLSAAGALSLIAKDLSPNGVTFARDGKTLYVTNGRGIVAFDVSPEGNVSNRRPFFDCSVVGKRGGPDGMECHSSGALFIGWLGGGVVVVSPEGKHLGTIRTDVRTANCCFDADESTLYITANNWLARVRLK